MSDKFVRQLIVVDSDGEQPYKAREQVSLYFPGGSPITDSVTMVFVTVGDEPRPDTAEGVVWLGGDSQPVNMAPGDLWYSEVGNEWTPPVVPAPPTPVITSLDPDNLTTIEVNDGTQFGIYGTGFTPLMGGDLRNANNSVSVLIEWFDMDAVIAGSFEIDSGVPAGEYNLTVSNFSADGQQIVESAPVPFEVQFLPTPLPETSLETFGDYVFTYSNPPQSGGMYSFATGITLSHLDKHGADRTLDLAGVQVGWYITFDSPNRAGSRFQISSIVNPLEFTFNGTLQDSYTTSAVGPGDPCTIYFMRPDGSYYRGVGG